MKQVMAVLSVGSLASMLLLFVGCGPAGGSGSSSGTSPGTTSPKTSSSSTDSSYAYSKARSEVADLKRLGMILGESGDTFVVDDMWYQLPSSTHKRNLVANCHVAHEGRSVRIVDSSGRLVASAEGGQITIVQ